MHLKHCSEGNLQHQMHRKEERPQISTLEFLPQDAGKKKSKIDPKQAEWRKSLKVEMKLKMGTLLRNLMKQKAGSQKKLNEIDNLD